MSKNPKITVRANIPPLSRVERTKMLFSLIEKLSLKERKLLLKKILKFMEIKDVR